MNAACVTVEREGVDLEEAAAHAADDAARLLTA
jgi:hypothetical protein